MPKLSESAGIKHTFKPINNMYQITVSFHNTNKLVLQII